MMGITIFALFIMLLITPLFASDQKRESNNNADNYPDIIAV